MDEGSVSQVLRRAERYTGGAKGLVFFVFEVEGEEARGFWLGFCLFTRTAPFQVM